NAETPLQLANLQADRRLRQIKLARRGRETAALHHFEQRVQLIEVEAAHPKRALSKSLKHKICLIRQPAASSAGALDSVIDSRSKQDAPDIHCHRYRMGCRHRCAFWNRYHECASFAKGRGGHGAEFHRYYADDEGRKGASG